MDMQMLQALMANMGAQQNQPAASPHLVEFKAGKLNQAGTRVTADSRKGKFVLTNGVDGLVHFQWYPRPGNEPEDDLMVFPGEFTFEKIPECTTGRVYSLTARSNNRRRFFWMQSLKEDQDEELVKKVSDILANGAPAGARAGGAAAAGAAGMGGLGGGLDELGMDQAQLLAMLGMAPAATAPPARTSAAAPVIPPSAAAPARPSNSATASAATPAPAGNSNNNNNNNNLPPTIASTVSATAPASSSSAPPALSAEQSQAVANNLIAALMNMQQQPADVDLQSVLDPVKVGPFLNDPEVLGQLLPHLPESQRSVGALHEQLQSAQMQQAINRLSEALHSSQMTALLNQFGLPHPGQVGVEAFLRAIEQQARGKESAPSASSASSADKNSDAPK